MNRLAGFCVQDFLISAMWKTYSLESDHLETRAISDNANWILPFVLSILNSLVIYRHKNSKGQCVVWVKEWLSSLYRYLQRKYIFVVGDVLLFVILELNKMSLILDSSSTSYPLLSINKWFNQHIFYKCVKEYVQFSKYLQSI